jgi:hypothetical protein
LGQRHMKSDLRPTITKWMTRISLIAFFGVTGWRPIVC